MPAPISVVIPTLNATEALPATTEALLPGLTDGLIHELILSDGGSSDDIETTAKELGAKVVKGDRGRGAQLARGIAASTSPWLLLLHADTHLSHDWPDAVIAHINGYPNDAGYFALEFRADGLWPKVIAKGANLRARYFGLPYGDQALLIQRTTLEIIGGMPDLPLMEDVALARLLKGRLRGLSATARTSAARYEQDGWLRRSLFNLTTLTRYGLGADPQILAKMYNQSRRTR